LNWNQTNITWDHAKNLDFSIVFNHISGTGAAFTKLYKPKGVLSRSECIGEFHEDMQVKEMMRKHGIDNVRGGTYSREKLTDIQRNEIKQVMTHAANQCYICKSTDHFVNKCPQRNQKSQRQRKFNLLQNK
jgi:3-oxoacyl-[acyl-carrier-protein] synthase III